MNPCWLFLWLLADNSASGPLLPPAQGGIMLLGLLLACVFVSLLMPSFLYRRRS